jgi:hypothetical protein
VDRSSQFLQKFTFEGFHRNCRNDFRPARMAVHGFHFAAMRMHKSFNDGQSQAGTSRPRVCSSIESLKNLVDLRLANAYSLIFNG